MVFGRREMAMAVLDYDRYWELRREGDETTLRARDIIISNRIESHSSILDIGCGTGRLLAHLAGSKQNVELFGLDVAPRAIEIARAKGLNCQVADVMSPEFNLERDYDYIVVSEVLEHLHNPEVLLLKLRGRYRKTLFVTIPNVGYYPHRLRLLFGSFPVQTVWHPAEHLRYWTIRDFEQWLQDLGFRANEVRASNGFPRLAKWWPNLLGNQVIFVLHPQRHSD